MNWLLFSLKLFAVSRLVWFGVLSAALLASLSPSATAQEEQEVYLSLDQARQYMVELINKDRAQHKLGPVILDPIACQAGQVHTNDMVINNHGGHYDCDGKKPWQRYTEAGGIGYVSENAFWWAGRSYEGSSAVNQRGSEIEQPYALHPVQTFKKSDVERAESEYYNEVPPNDGHRKNILDPIHNGVGIAFSLASNGTHYRIANTQEFTDNYGQFDPLPNNVSQPFTVSGILSPGWKVQSISIAWEPEAKPMTPEEINKMHSYKHPTKDLETFFPLAYTKQPIQVRSVNGLQQFSIRVTPNSNWKKGLIYVDIRAEYSGKKAEMISRRTIRNF